MRRRPGALLPIEHAVLSAGVDGLRGGKPEFHGFQIAKALQEREGARRLTSHGTLYKALDRMERTGLLTSRWEDPQAAASEQRPRRRLYRVTPAGEVALMRSQAELALKPARWSPEVAAQ